MISDILKALIKFPDRNAFCIQDQFYTYSETGQIISNISKVILPLKSDLATKHIGVLINGDIQSYASCISVLLCGCGYVPLNPLNPIERNIEIMRQADVKILLSSDISFEHELKENDPIKYICTKDLENTSVDYNFPQANDNDPAYVIFTSGSTGKPKGSPISQCNLNAFLDSVYHIPWDINEKDKFLQMSSMTFDMSILTFIIPLCVGACIYTVPENEIKYLYGYQLMEKHDITFIAVVPSTLSYLKPYFPEICLKSVRYSLVCGESFPVELADLWQDCVPNAKIINIYGPTEATVFTHSYEFNKVTSRKSYNNILALGNIVKNMTAIIVDEKGNEVALGEKGEICITGKQLTSGYLKNPEKNHECFFIKQINGIDKRFYRTGDIVYKDDDSCYYYAGRKDHQVKIQGHRVELNEIEKHARDITKTENAIAIAHKNQFGNYQIHLFTIKGDLSSDKIIEYLKSKIPYYMIPSGLSFLEIFPLNSNGKIDRIALEKMIK
jgi:amino acid adenylation domain-containing protein